jgi:type IV pilus assembly protein PilW
MMRSMTRRGQQGMTLIEMMVAIVISMVMSLAVFGVMSSFEGQRRTVRSGADLDQAGSVAMFQIDQWVRSAGTGFTQAVGDGSNLAVPKYLSYVFGCQLFAAKSGSQLLPMPSAMPAPFASVLPGPTGSTGIFRLAPAVILPGQTTPGASGKKSDVLVVMSAGSSDGQVPTAMASAATAATITLENSVPLQPSDFVLLANSQPSATGGAAPCMVSQVSSSFTLNSPSVPLSGTWYAATVGASSVASYPSTTGTVLDFGSLTSGTPPSLQVVGVGDNNTLYSYDILQLTSSPLQARGDSVFELHALYGVDTTGDGKVDAWVTADTGSYTPSTLLDGSQTAAALLKNIKALRVGLIMRTALPERDTVNTSPTLSLFSDLGSTLTYSRTLTGSELNYRYRTIEATIPLRNNAF